MTQETNLTDFSGDTVVQTFEYLDGAIPIDISGHVARCSLRAKIDDTAATLALTSSPAAGVVVDGANGLVTVTINATQSAALFGDYVWSVEIEASSVITTLASGTWTFVQKPTR